jgi:hypothetical protein
MPSDPLASLVYVVSHNIRGNNNPDSHRNIPEEGGKDSSRMDSRLQLADSCEFDEVHCYVTFHDTHRSILPHIRYNTRSFVLYHSRHTATEHADTWPKSQILSKSTVTQRPLAVFASLLSQFFAVRELS